MATVGVGLGALGSENLDFVEQLYARFLADPASVEPGWREVFGAFAGEPGSDRAPAGPSFDARGIFNPPEASAVPASAPAPLAPDVGPAELARRLPLLAGVGLLRGLPEAELSHLARFADRLTFEPGASLARRGAVGTDLLVIASGAAVIRRDDHAVTELAVGEAVGAASLLDREPASADVLAKSRVEVLRLRREDLLGLVRGRPSFAQEMVQALSRRVREAGSRQDRVDQLIRGYRVRGHLLADLDPLGRKQDLYPELDPAHHGFGPEDMDTAFSSATIPGAPVMTLREILHRLRKTYCRSIGVQFMHIDDLRSKMWLQERMERTQNERALSRDEQLRILTKLTDAEIFEQFIHKKFMGAKRFSAEGAESLIPLLDMAIEAAGEKGIEEIVIGMAHRGRLNVLANVLGKSPRQIFREFDDTDPDRMMGKGDVKYHLGYSADRVTSSGRRVHLSLAFNPSHLEFVSPVVIGRVRAKQDRAGDVDRRRGMGIVIHGDAAFAGQGVVQETFNLSELEGYRTGGTLHIVVNNQIGFTTDPDQGRSTQYATDIAKMLQIPVFHVNGEQPEAVAQAIALAMDFREAFQKDVVIDMYCYRRYGHNEGDEPAFTQPLLYRTIRQRKSVREGYLDNLFALGGITPAEAERITIERREALEAELGVARSPTYEREEISSGQGWWQPFRGGKDTAVPDADTTVPRARLEGLLARLARVPEGFTPHPKLRRLLEAREQMSRGELALDWAAGEALAFATLLEDGTRVRLGGQDCERGTFSHRHAVLHDHETGARFPTFAHVSPTQAPFEVFNSALSEIGVLGFEYGYSLDYPDALVIWEAQFGDFANVAQVIIDQFIVSGEDKWSRLSGLTLLLPHGFEGQGPEHSSARLERFLGAAAEDNIQVANVTTPAQLFHLLRRQVVRPIRKPLVVMSPKSLLRHPRVASSLDDLATGGFRRILPDESGRVAPAATRRVILTSGKVYYELEKAREDRGAWDVAIVRLEQYYPLRVDELAAALAPYPAGTPVVWVQEEPRNMGAWGFLRLRLGERLADRHPFSVVSRPESASPATGSGAAHKKEQERLLEQAFEA